MLSWISATLRNTSTQSRPDLPLSSRASIALRRVSYLLLSHRRSLPSVLQRVCSPLLWCNAAPSFVFLSAGRPQPGLCALIICASNSTDPRFPVGIWAQSASHLPPTFVAWDYRSLKNLSLSFPRPSRLFFPWGSFLRGVMQDGACVSLNEFVRCFINVFV
jgi:hypothetical protein